MLIVCRMRSDIICLMSSALSVTAAIVFLSVAETSYGFTTGNETLLRKTLFITNGYDESVHPEEPTIVTLRLVLTSLNSIDVKAETMSMSGWWVMCWNDSRLVWQPEQYDNISQTHVFGDAVWNPTIVVFNSILNRRTCVRLDGDECTFRVNDLSAIEDDTIPVSIQSTGQLEWNPPCILSVSCVTDITHFPFDIQTCGVSVKTFGYTVDHLVLQADDHAVDLTYFCANGEWKLLKAWTDKSNNQDKSQVTFKFSFKRKAAYYGLNLILPVMMMSLLSAFIFALPPECGEKMGFSLTSLLSFIVLMTLLADHMPSTADHISYFEVYVILILGLSALSVVLSIFILGIYFREDQGVISKRAYNVTRFFQRLLHSQDTTKTESAFPTDKEVSISTEEKSLSSKNNSRPGARDEQEVTWRKMAIVLDTFLLRAYIFLIVFLTIIFLTFLVII